MIDYDFNKKYIETSSQVLGLCTPASRPAQVDQQQQKFYSTPATASHPLAPLSTNNLSQEQVNLMVTNLEEGEIMKGLHVNDALLPSRCHLIKEVSVLVDYSDNLIVSLSSLRVLAQISQLHQYEPDPNLVNLAPNRLLAILQEEPGVLEKVRNNFRRRLEREECENVQFLADGKDFPNLISTWSLLNAQGDEIDRIISPEFCEAFGLTNYIRLFIVNFFVENVTKNSFNLVHHLLGFSQESKDLNLFDGCLSLLIDMLMYGLGHPSVEAPVIFIEHPALGVKLLNLLKFLLLAPEKIATPAREYLRNDRKVFYELASKINTRLLQVSFSVDKGYTLSNDHETVLSAPVTDLNFYVFELKQKAELFQIFAIDLHEAFTNGQNGLYIEKVLKSFFKTTIGSSSNEFVGTSTLTLGESRIIDFLAAIDSITEDSYLKRIRAQNEGEFERALVIEFEAACGVYIESLVMLMSEVLTILVDMEEMVQEKESFINSLQSWIWKFLQKSTLTSAAIESLVQLIVLTDCNLSAPKSSQDSLDAQISVLLRPEINVTIRCYLYTSLMRQNYQTISQNLPEDRFLRLVELITQDASISSPGAVNDSLVTVALSILEFLNRARPDLLQDALLSNTSATNSFYYSIPTAVTSTAPFIPGLLSSLKVDDAIACSLISSSSLGNDEDFSVFLKWRAKWSLLLNLVVRKESGIEKDDRDISSNFANRFIDNGFLESIVFKLRCLSLPVAYHLVDCGYFVLASILPVLKFICALGMVTGRQIAVASRLLDLFRTSDVFDAFAVIISNSPSESHAPVHVHVIHYILLLVNAAFRESKSDDLSGKFVSFRHAVLKQVVRKSWWIHRYGRISSGSFVFSSDEVISNRLQTEVQVLQEFMEFLTRDSNQSIDTLVSSLSFIPSEFNEDLEISLSLGTLIFLLKICISKIQEGREKADFLTYLVKNLENLSQSDLEIIFNSKNKLKISLDDTESILNRINQLYTEILELQNHLVILIEKSAFLLLKHLRLKLSPISVPSGGFSTTFYVDNRSPHVQTARSLKSDASIIVLPVIETYHKNIRLVDSSANSSLYMTTLHRDFFNLLSTQATQSNGIFEI